MKNVTICSILLFHAVFVSLGNDSKIIKYVCVVLLIMFLMNHTEVFFKKTYRKINISVLAFAVLIISSSFYSFLHPELAVGRVYVSPFSGILLALCIIDTFFLFEYLHYRGEIKECIKVLHYLSFFYVIIANIYAMSHLPSLQNETSADYIIGNKFVLSYLNIFFVTTYYFLNKDKIKDRNFKNILIVLLLLTVSVFIARKTYCSTGVIGGVCFFVFIFFSHILKPILSSRIILFSVIIASSLFALFIDFVLSIPIVEYVIVDVLGEDLTLTGRTFIYGSLIEIIKRSPWWGYGYGNSTFVIPQFVGFGNAQNGVLENLINYGIIGLAGFMFLTYCSFSFSKQKVNSYPFVCLIYFYLITSTVEITLGLNFLCILPLVAFCDNDKVLIMNERQTAILNSVNQQNNKSRKT